MTYEDYKKSIHLFTNTLFIKLTDIGVSTNLYLKEATGIDYNNNDESTWKYFLNMAGIKHSTNSNVYINTRETGELVELTKDLLLSHSNTRRELFKQSDYYNQLVATYPTETLYIHGCMYGLELEKVLSAKDGDILAYNRNFIEDQEYNLITELQQFIKAFISRWRMSFFTTDDLYVAGLVGVLYANIVPRIHSIRIGAAGTATAHSFHMEMFFKSNLDLWDDVSVLNKESLYWLYANFKNLLRQAGRNNTLSKIAKNIFDSNNIGLGEYILQVNTPKRDVLDFRSGYTRREPVFKTSAINKTYEFRDGDSFTMTDIITKEIAVTKNLLKNLESYEIDSVVNSTIEYLSNSVAYDQKTKILDVAIPEVVMLHGVDPIMYIIHKLIYNIATNRYVTKITYIEPNTKEMYDITPKQGLVLLLKFMLSLTDSENDTISNIQWVHNVNEVSDPILLDDITYAMFGKYQSKPLIDYIVSKVPVEMSKYYDVAEYKNYMIKQFDLLRYIWLSISNANNIIVSANINLAFERMLKKGEYVLSEQPKRIDDILIENKLTFTTDSNFDIYSSIRELLIAMTGLDIDFYSKAEERRTKFKNILRKLTSYAVQVVDSVDTGKKIFVPISNPNLLYLSADMGDNENTPDDNYDGNNDGVPDDLDGDGLDDVTHKPINISSCYNKHGVITVLSGEIAFALEPSIFWIRGYGNSFHESSIGYNDQYVNNVDAVDKLNIVGIYSNDKIINTIQIDHVNYPLSNIGVIGIGDNSIEYSVVTDNINKSIPKIGTDLNIVSVENAHTVTVEDAVYSAENIPISATGNIHIEYSVVTDNINKSIPKIGTDLNIVSVENAHTVTVEDAVYSAENIPISATGITHIEDSLVNNNSYIETDTVEITTKIVQENTIYIDIT